MWNSGFIQWIRNLMTHDVFRPLNTRVSKHLYLKLTTLSPCSCLCTCGYTMKFMVHAKVYVMEVYEKFGFTLKKIFWKEQKCKNHLNYSVVNLSNICSKTVIKFPFFLLAIKLTLTKILSFLHINKIYELFKRKI